MHPTKEDKLTNTAYMLRTSDANRKSFGGFVWPESGAVSAPDWNAAKHCGGGLHGLLWGEGTGALLSRASDAVWQVVAVDPDTVVDLGGKVKVPAGEVMYSGAREGAISFLEAHGAADKAVVYASRTAGDYGTATAGDYGILVIAQTLTRRRLRVAYVGEDGVLPNTAYRLNTSGNFVPA